MSTHERALDAPLETLSPQDALALLARLASTPAAVTTRNGEDGLREALIALIAEVLKLSPEEVRPEQPLVELGLDSISATDLIGRFNDQHELSIPSTILFEFDNVADLSTHLWETHHPALATRYGATKSGPALTPVPSHSLDLPPPSPPRPPAAPRTQTRQAPLAAAPEAAPARRMDVKTMWAEIEAQTLNQAPAAPASTLPDTGTWSICETSLARLLPQARCVAVPNRDAALTLLHSAGGDTGSRCIWLGNMDADSLQSIDPQGEEALEDLLEAQGENLIVCLSATEASGAFPSHLLRALERMRERNRGFLAVFADGPQQPDGAALRTLTFDALIVGESPMMAVAMAPALANRVGAERLVRFQRAYRNDWSAAGLLQSLNRLSGDTPS